MLSGKICVSPPATKMVTKSSTTSSNVGFQASPSVSEMDALFM